MSTSTRERPLIRSAPFAVTILGCLIAASPLHGQTTEETGASSALEASVTLSTVRGETSFFVGGTGLLNTGGRVAVGGAGWIQTSETAIPTGSPGLDLQLLVAYGGLAAQVAVLRRAPVRIFLRTLVGAGSAKIRLPVVDTEIAADNFGVVEPEAAFLRQLTGGLGIGAGLGYRFVFGVEDLPGVLSGDLSGPVARVCVRVGTF